MEVESPSRPDAAATVDVDGGGLTSTCCSLLDWVVVWGSCSRSSFATPFPIVSPVASSSSARARVWLLSTSPHHGSVDVIAAAAGLGRSPLHRPPLDSDRSRAVVLVVVGSPRKSLSFPPWWPPSPPSLRGVSTAETTACCDDDGRCGPAPTASGGEDGDDCVTPSADAAAKEVLSRDWDRSRATRTTSSSHPLPVVPSDWTARCVFPSLRRRVVDVPSADANEDKEVRPSQLTSAAALR